MQLSMLLYPLSRRDYLYFGSGAFSGHSSIFVGGASRVIGALSTFLTTYIEEVIMKNAVPQKAHKISTATFKGTSASLVANASQ
jgi:hypothetical protein